MISYRFHLETVWCIRGLKAGPGQVEILSVAFVNFDTCRFGVCSKETMDVGVLYFKRAG